MKGILFDTPDVSRKEKPNKFKIPTRPANDSLTCFIILNC